MDTQLFFDQISEHIECFQALKQMAPDILHAAMELTATIESG